MHLLNISKRKDLKSDIQKKNDELEEYKRILKIQKSNIIGLGCQKVTDL